MVHRESRLYSWPDSTILGRMFDHVSTSVNPDDGGLAIDGKDLLREAYKNPDSQYEPGPDLLVGRHTLIGAGQSPNPG